MAIFTLIIMMMGSMRVLVVYYSQTGQLRNIIDSVIKPLMTEGFEVGFAEIVPEPAFPFPWPSDRFFQAFPESFMGIPCPIKQMNPTHDDYDLIILGYSPWYLSPSMPMHAFMQSTFCSELIKGKPVVTIIGCRNMWLMAQEKMKQYLDQKGAKLVGNIALCDKAPNLVSVLTIIRWMFRGKKMRSGLFPDAGVSEADIIKASGFGQIIKEAMLSGNYSSMQEKLITAGAVEVKPHYMLFEKNGSRIFKMWASKAMRRGPYSDPRRNFMLKLFKYYLFVVLFLISPLGQAVFFFIKLFNAKKIKNKIAYFQRNAAADAI